MNERIRNAISLPNILFGVEEEEIENLIEEIDGEERNVKISAAKEDKDVDGKTKWYKKLGHSGALLLQPIRDSILKFKRKRDHYQLQGLDEKEPVDTSENNNTDVFTPKKKLSTDLDIHYESSYFYRRVETVESKGRPRSFVDNFGEARAIARKRIRFTDIFCARYRKF
eukprot:gene7872-8723_t